MKKIGRRTSAGKRKPRPGASRQKKHKGGSFHSEDQRRWMWSNAPRAAKKWAHNRATRPSDWAGHWTTPPRKAKSR